MTVVDGTVLGTTQIYGGAAPLASAFNIVLLAEGFTSAEQAAFNTACNDFLWLLSVTPPFSAPEGLYNVFRVNVASTQSGADDPVAATPPGTGAVVATYFDATFGAEGLRRLLVCDQGTALMVAYEAVPEASAVLVVVNSPIYGGSGGAVGTYSLHPDSSEIALHELGHVAFGLADEYSDLAGPHPGPEPTEPNVTRNTDPATLKWAALLTPTVPIPTTTNAGCVEGGETPSPVPWGSVGLFEGGDRHHCGVYRPEVDCKMRTLYTGYCAVCTEVIAARLGSKLSFGIVIDDVDRTDQTRATGSLRMEYTLGALARCSLETRDYDSYATAYRPTIDQRLAVTGPPELGQRLIFNGMILKVEDKPLGAPGVGTVTRVEAVSNWRAATKRRVSAKFPAGASLKNHVNYLTVTFLQDFNIYIDPGMPDGPIMGAIVYDQITVEAAFNHLADLTGWVYRLRPAIPNDVVEMFPIGWALRPMHLSAANRNIRGAVTWGKTREVYLNRVILRYGTGLVARRQTFVGDGVTRAFPLGDSAGGPPGPFVNYYGGGGTVNLTDEWVGDGVNLAFPMRRPFIYTPGTFVTYYGDTYPPEGGLEPVGNPGDGLPWHHDPLNNLVRNPGIPGPSNPPGINVKFTYGYQTEGHEEGCARPGDGMPWYVDPQNNLIRDPGIPGISNPPAAGVVIEYTHNVQFPRTVIAEDEADIAAHGVWEDLFDAADVFETDEAQVVAESLLRKHLPTPRRVMVRTRFSSDFLPGDTVQLLDVPERTLPVGPYLVIATVVEIEADQGVTTTLTLLEGDTAQDSWLDFWRNAFGSGSNAGIVTGSVQPSPAPGPGGGSGGGGGDLTGSGTAPQLAVWNGEKSLTNSGISVSGGRFTSGGTGVGFEINFTQSTIVGTLPLANIPVLTKAKLPTTVAYTDQANLFTVGPQRFGGTGPSISLVGRNPDDWSLLYFVSNAVGNPYVAQLNAHPTVGMNIHSSMNLGLYADGGNITIHPAGALVLPQNKYHTSLGKIDLKFAALHCAELWVETLVAQNTLATIGGRILVGPTSILTRELLSTEPAYCYMWLKYPVKVNPNDGVHWGSSLIMEAAGKFEAFQVVNTAAETVIEPDGSYRYTVNRLAGGPHNWYAGDAVFDTGTTGDGFIDLYSRSSLWYSTVGPTIVGNVRTSHVPGAWAYWANRWAIGNLNGLYGVGTPTYGAAFGDYAGTHVIIDASSGFRIRWGNNPNPDLRDRFFADIYGNLTLAGNLTIGAAGIFRTADAVDFTHGIGIYMTGGAQPKWRVGDPDNGSYYAKQISWDGNVLKVGMWVVDQTQFVGSNIYMSASGLLGVGGQSASALWVSGYSNTARLWLGTSIQDGSGYKMRIMPDGSIYSTTVISAPHLYGTNVDAHYFRSANVSTNYIFGEPGVEGFEMNVAGIKYYFRGNPASTGPTFFPLPTGGAHLGWPSYRWSNLYLTGSVINTADRDSATEIRPGTLGLAFLERLEVRRFTDLSSRVGNQPRRGQYGFILDEIRAALGDELFAAIDEHGIDYARFVPVLTKAIQELAARVRELEQ